MSWETVRLDSLFTVKHGFAFKSDFFASEGKYILLTPGNCHEAGGLRLRGDREKFYAGEVPDGYLLEEGELLVVMTDLVNTAPLLGGAFLIPEGDRYLHNQRLGLVRLKNGGIDKKFLYYLLNTEPYRGQVRGSASGATVRHTSPERIGRCVVRVPTNVTKQRRIADTLSAYDDLSENNRRRIALLEKSARLLYREWFVHLRFPGHEHVKVVDGVPEGWRKERLTDLAEITMGQSPTSDHYNKDRIGFPFHQGVTGFGERFVEHETWCDVRGRMAMPMDILFSVRAPVGRLNVTRDEMVIGRGLSALRSKHDLQSMLFYQLANHFFKEDMIGGGAIFASVTKKELEGQLMLMPSLNLACEFNEVASSIDHQIGVLVEQNRKLREARGLLLPRLMSGDLVV